LTAFRSPVRDATLQRLAQVSGVAVEQFKVLNRVVLPVVVLVVNDFRFRQEAAEVLLHYQTVFSNQPVRVAVGMVRAVKQDVTSFVDASAADPPRVVRSVLVKPLVGNAMSGQPFPYAILAGAYGPANRREGSSFRNHLQNQFSVSVASRRTCLAMTLWLFAHAGILATVR
jgi:hypothetical protein